VTHFPHWENQQYVVCFVCFELFYYWPNYARHYGGHSQIDRDGCKDPLSAYWVAQLGMLMGNPSLFTLNEYKCKYDNMVRKAKNKRERERVRKRKVIEKKKPQKIIHRDWEKMECLIEYYPYIL
jgi:hypothetical protein